MALALITTLAALSLNINPPNHQSAEPGPGRIAAPNKRCARARLNSFKQATKMKFGRRRDKTMTSRAAKGVVIEISDDEDEDEDEDEGELPYRRPPAPPPPSRRSQVGLVDADDEVGSDDSFESESSDLDAPPRRKRQVPLHRKRWSDEELRQRTTSSGTTSDASSRLRGDLRRQHSSLRTGATTVSTQEDFNQAEVTPDSGRLNGTGPSTHSAPIPILTRTKAVRQTEPCPYYYDPMLEVMMYRGEGFEKFPVVLGTVEGHQEICDRWDAQVASITINKDRQSLDTGTPSPASSTAALELEDMCLQAVLQIFPEVEHEFVRNLYRKSYIGAVAEDVVGTVSGALIADIADLETYPKQKTLKRKASTAARDETGVTIGWNKDLRKNPNYCRETVILLATVFDHIPTHYIWKLVQEKQSLFDATGVLLENEDNFYSLAPCERQYKRLRHARKLLELKYQRKSHEQRDSHLYVGLVNELQAVRQHQARELSRIKRQKASDDLETENLAVHIAQGSMVECQCCFDEKPINRAVPCEGEEAHFFCNECVRRQAESQVGAMKYQMVCMDTSGCKAELSGEGVAQAIPLQLYDRLAFNQQQAEVSLAGIQGLEMCPFCDFKAICQPVEVDTVFDCQNPDCGIVSCRKCKERSHLPKSCEEVKKDKGLGARHKVEEARSEAMMRTCPKCKVKLIKEYGCNKMVCSNCQAIMCYVCQKDISGTGKEHGYDHFHRSGATCALHDTSGVDRHEAEADAAETAAIALAKAEYEDIDEKALQIETGKDKKKRPSANQTPGVLPPPPQFIPYQRYYGAVPQAPIPDRYPIPAGAQDAQPFHYLPNQVHGQVHGQVHAQVLGDLQQDMERMHQLIGQRLNRPPNVPDPAPPRHPGEQQRRALQVFLEQRRRNRA